MIVGYQPMHNESSVNPSEPISIISFFKSHDFVNRKFQ